MLKAPSVLSIPGVKRAPQPSFIGRNTDAELFFRPDRCYIKFHLGKIPRLFYNTKATSYQTDMQMDIVVELLRFFYIKKIHAHPRNYRELLQIATNFTFQDLECELLFNMDRYLTFMDVKRLNDQRLYALFCKKLRLSLLEAVRYQYVQKKRELNKKLGCKKDFLAIYETGCTCCKGVSCKAPFSAPHLQYQPPECIRSLTRFQFTVPEDTNLVRISFVVQDIYGHAKAKIYITDSVCKRTMMFECRAQNKSLAPFGRIMIANIPRYSMRSYFFYKIVIDLEGSIFVDNTPGHAKVTLVTQTGNRLSYDFMSLPLAEAFETRFAAMEKRLRKNQGG